MAVAAREEPLAGLLEPLTEAGRWSALAHLLDFDDLHLPSTAHISAVCVPVALAAGGGARDYLAGAGVMARLGIALIPLLGGYLLVMLKSGGTEGVHLVSLVIGLVIVSDIVAFAVGSVWGGSWIRRPLSCSIRSRSWFLIRSLKTAMTIRSRSDRSTCFS